MPSVQHQRLKVDLTNQMFFINHSLSSHISTVNVQWGGRQLRPKAFILNKYALHLLHTEHPTKRLVSEGCYPSLMGFSRFALKVSRNLVASSSSTTRLSLDIVTVISWCCRSWGFPSSSSVSFSTGRNLPTAKIQAWGGLITAVNSSMPNIPKFEILEGRKTLLKVAQSKLGMCTLLLNLMLCYSKAKEHVYQHT